MAFVVVRSSQPGCEPTCPEWISAEGEIVANTPAQLKKLLKTLGGRKLPIVVSSPGGHVDAALALGRMVRKYKLDVAVGKTRFVGCQPAQEHCTDNDGKGAHYLGEAYASGAFCNSACPLMLAGGARRLVGQWAFLGVHQITTTFTKTQLTYRTKYRVVNGKKRTFEKKIVGRKKVGNYTTYEMDRATERKLAAYLKEMGVDRSILETIKGTPASEIRQIAPFDLLKWKLVTSPDAVDLLTSAAACNAVPAAGNCRVVSALPTVAAEPASDEDIQQMRFVVVRSNEPGCEPTCPEWISADGRINARTPALLKRALKGLGGRKLPVVVSSPGGDAYAAMALGRMIRKSGLSVAVGKTRFVGCQPDQKDCRENQGKAARYVGSADMYDAYCASACPLILAGGVERLAGRLGVVGLNQVATPVMDKPMERKLATYLKEMGVDQAVLKAIKRTPATDVRLPTVGDMRRMTLVTSADTVEALTARGICKDTPAPDNCRVLKQ